MTSNAKLYGIERADGTIIQEFLSFGESPESLASCLSQKGERVVEIVAVKAERLRALEAVVVAADRTVLLSLPNADGAGYDAREDYHKKRALVGKIGG